MMAPAFWDQDGLLPRLLTPLGWVYQAGGALRRRLSNAADIGIPVICVGNLVAGGAGKTPVARAIGHLLSQDGRQVGFLSRGHGGALAGPVRVEPVRHGAREVGDEALLLAEVAPTWIARDRRLAGQAARAAGIDVVIMDDGFQSPNLQKSLSLVVVDGRYGFGNERVMPAGPLREPIDSGLARADAMVLIGEDRHGLATRLRGKPPVLEASVAPSAQSAPPPGTTVVAFAGIARPEKFRASLDALGLAVAAFEAFPDHHPFQTSEISRIRERAIALNAVPVTTAKDHVRLAPEDRAAISRIDISLVWRDLDALQCLLDKAIDHAPG